MRRLLLLATIVLVSPPSRADGPGLRLPVTRDTWFSEVGDESVANLGGAARLKLKSYQEMSLIDIDPAPLRGRSVASTALHVRRAAEPRLLRVTVGSFGAEWVEGTSPSYRPQPGSSSFRWRRNPDVPWTVPGSDLCSVMLGQGGTAWHMADASTPDDRGWQVIAVDPSIVARRVAGVSYGFLLFDDNGSEWTREGEHFETHHMPNRFVYSREQGRDHAPYLTVVPGPDDRSPPAAPGDLRSEAGDLPAGEAWISWATPRDVGPSGTVGFFARVEGRDVPRHLIPLPSKHIGRVTMHLRDLDLTPGASVALAVRAVDGAGNVGPEASTRARVSDRAARPLPGSDPGPFEGSAPLPKLGKAEVAILDELDKVQPITGAMIPEQPDGYRAANHLWSARERRIRLQSARNEFVAFQVLLLGAGPDVRPSLSFAGSPEIKAEFGRYQHVETGRGPLPDPIVPLDGADEPAIPGRRSRSLHVEVYVPHDAKPGEHAGRLTLTDGRDSVAIDVTLQVWDFTLPDFLSFLPEMNCYGLPSNERDYYRLAHRHRTVINRVPYSQDGSVHDGCAPAWDGKALDWAAWDRRFGPYFDGSAFADLPRRGVPIETFYLPIHENWPTPMEGNYNGDYWADRAFPESYRRALVSASRQFAEHIQGKGWRDTFFEFFLNGKLDFKRAGWSRGSSPWLLDEPANFQDFWALRYFGRAFHEGADAVDGPAKLVFRADVSRPEWQRDSLDGLLDVNVTSSSLRTYHRIVMDRKRAEGQVVFEYGSTVAVEGSNTQPVGWSLDAWSLGADGVLPWQTVGRSESWTRADPLALFYPARERSKGPVPSVRLKAYRRGQQDVEYLTLLAVATGEPRWAVGREARKALRLVAERQGTGAAGEDAGRMTYARLRPQDAWSLRVRLGRALSDLHPAPSRRLVELRTPRRDAARLPSDGALVGDR